ncbi:serine hydrolase [Nonomuraea diastatica]|uniref:serine hydrolase n=1 Tax=Nonomuraea diastatica TaxID=1848329 RepID=UPI001C6FFB6B|nr:serine hydrolase domain-containing protein [Nonomuraea diastatica]
MFPAIKGIALAAVLALPIGVASPREQGYDRADLQRDTDAVRAAGVVGVQARVVGPGGENMVATSGVADLRTRRPVPVGGHFRIGSNNKSLVATVVLQLAGEKRLSLEDTVERWLPGVVKGNGNDGTRISVRTGSWTCRLTWVRPGPVPRFRLSPCPPGGGRATRTPCSARSATPSSGANTCPTSAWWRPT